MIYFAIASNSILANMSNMFFFKIISGHFLPGRRGEGRKDRADVNQCEKNFLKFYSFVYSFFLYFMGEYLIVAGKVACKKSVKWILKWLWDISKIIQMSISNSQANKHVQFAILFDVRIYTEIIQKNKCWTGN